MSTSILQASAFTLQQRLTAGEITSVHLVKEFLNQIEKHNTNGMRLNAVISILDRDLALETAKRLDEERKYSRVRSGLHGIPIIIKDCIVTGPDLGMSTTVGSHVFGAMQGKQNAPLVNQLIENGVIILGKGNLTESCGLKSNDTPIGWSAYMGQTLSAHKMPHLSEKDQPTCGGSTSGPATSIAAGFCSIGIGTETAGSTVYPASCCGLYGMKLTPGSVSTKGVFKLSESFDSIGVLGTTPYDLALLTDAIVREAKPKPVSERLSSLTARSWSDLGVGVVTNTWGVAHAIEKWCRPEVKIIYESVPHVLESKGAKVIFPLNIPGGDILKVDEDNLGTVAYHEFPREIEEFLTNFDRTTSINSLDDIIKWNEQNADISLPDPYKTQTELIKSRDNKMTEQRHNKVLSELRRIAINELEKSMADGLDIVLAPSDSTMVSYAACAGWPIATVPLGRLDSNGQPFGLFAIAREGSDDLLLNFMALFEKAFPAPKRASCPFD
ncbi:amidase signature enzyme [Hypoxylon trugodes]|uniref:amidase signature enzyme n=1 Tax=Hypoxylon trugodes TaxID=326681 RepID=UPI00218EF225|nr:amidase signature enzyme [Hypoxylon trugodes]KAI1385137.1 amidase signature enzyme [Hypoxylon trugodes]